jgi:hypothetical protein
MLGFSFGRAIGFAGASNGSRVLNEDFAQRGGFGASFGYEVHQNS